MLYTLNKRSECKRDFVFSPERVTVSTFIAWAKLLFLGSVPIFERDYDICAGVATILYLHHKNIFVVQKCCSYQENGRILCIWVCFCTYVVHTWMFINHGFEPGWGMYKNKVRCFYSILLFTCLSCRSAFIHFFSCFIGNVLWVVFFFLFSKTMPRVFSTMHLVASMLSARL